MARSRHSVPRLVPDAGDPDGVRWDGWRVLLASDAEYVEEYASAPHEQRVYGRSLRNVTEADIAAEIAQRAERAKA